MTKGAVFEFRPPALAYVCNVIFQSVGPLREAQADATAGSGTAIRLLRDSFIRLAGMSELIANSRRHNSR